MIPYSIHSMTLESPIYSLVYDSFWTHGHDLSVVIPRSESVGFTFGMAWQGVLDFGSGPTLQIESWVMQQKCQRRVSFWGNYPLTLMNCIVFRVIKAMAHCVAYVHDRPKDNDYFRVHTTCIWYFKYLCSASSLKQRSQKRLYSCLWPCPSVQLSPSIAFVLRG